MSQEAHNRPSPQSDARPNAGPDALFAEFLWLWNRHESLPTPTPHRRMAQWLDEAYKAGDERLLLQAFRACGKSTICGLFAAWLLYKRPEHRIMILAAEHHLATKMVRNVKHIIEHHPLIGDLKPQRPEQWAASELTVRRRAILRDPSVVAHGIGGNFTGSRADVIICDDVEVPNNCDSVKKRQDLREKLSEIDYVLNPGGMQIYVGTPHSYYSVYAHEARSEAGEKQAFLHDFRRLEIPLLDAQGDSAWQEKFPHSYIELLRRRQGPNKFASQMLLQPMAPKAGMLNPDLLRIYDAPLQFSEANDSDILTLQGKRLLSASCWWDPAFGEHDDSVIACVFSDAEGCYYLHDLLRIRVDDDAPEDNARQQCRQVAKFLRDNYQISVHVETNGIGKFLPSLLRRVLEEEKISASVVEVFTHDNKAARILRAFDALLAARQLHVHKTVAAGEGGFGGGFGGGFMREMREWDISASGNRDDALDAVAGCIHSEPVRLPRQFLSFTQPSWRHHLYGQTLKADSRFKI